MFIHPGAEAAGVEHKFQQRLAIEPCRQPAGEEKYREPEEHRALFLPIAGADQVVLAHLVPALFAVLFELFHSTAPLSSRGSNSSNPFLLLEYPNGFTKGKRKNYKFLTRALFFSKLCEGRGRAPASFHHFRTIRMCSCSSHSVFKPVKSRVIFFFFYSWFDSSLS